MSDLTNQKMQCDVAAIKKRLWEFRESQYDIDIQVERSERLEEKMRSLRSPVLSDMPKTPGVASDRIADMVAQKDSLDRKIREMVERQSDERRWIESVLRKLPKADERNVITLRYIDQENWDMISKMLYGAKEDFEEREDSYLRRTTKLHGRALQHMSVVVSGKSPDRKSSQ